MRRTWKQVVREVVAGTARRRCLNISLQHGRYLTPEQQAEEHERALKIAREWKLRKQKI